MRYIVIMAGGLGSRFWPSSTEQRPKQFLDILGIGRSLLQMTYDRSLALVPNDQIIVVTNKAYINLVAEQLPELPMENILGEPSRNNTAPCVAYTALHLLSRKGAISFAVLSSDHVILKEKEFEVRINEAFEYAEKNESILTLSIKPSRPDTGYGYCEVAKDDTHAIKKVISFKEKPDLAKAKEYLQAGTYSWNSGIFIWSIDTLLKAFKKYSPHILNTLATNLEKFGTKEEESYLEAVYPLTENISIDYAIMEKADNVYTLIADLGWSDLGTWNSLHSFLEKDENLNVVQAVNPYIVDVQNSIIKVDGNKKVVIKGLENFIVIDEIDALLIYPKSDEQEIKAVVSLLNNQDKR